MLKVILIFIFFVILFFGVILLVLRTIFKRINKTISINTIVNNQTKKTSN